MEESKSNNLNLTEASVTAPSVAASHLQVLIVDDNEAMRVLLRRLLHHIGYSEVKALEASNGWEALEIVQVTQPNLIISDWNMPELNGINLLRRLRSRGESIAFGFLTSEDKIEVRNQAFAEGASFLLNKPVRPAALQEVLQTFLTSSPRR